MLQDLQDKVSARRTLARKDTAAPGQPMLSAVSLIIAFRLSQSETMQTLGLQSNEIKTHNQHHDGLLRCSLQKAPDGLW